jgi:cysteinyl-tRNA synthetase
MVQEIQLYNHLTRKKEVLRPIEPGHVKMYACGVTVYDDCHIGHAMQAIYFDVIRNYLKFAGYRVTYVRNYTDVDDKIIRRASELGIAPKDLAEKVIKSSIEDMRRLGIKPADAEPRVSDHIPQITAMVERLIANGAAYKTADGDVYYRVRSKRDYGKLSNRKPDELRSGTREIAETAKEDELDFALWKKDSTPGASWESPWGQGRPGWHIECSAMSKAVLGESFDIHGGGLDLIFPHHENEMAQSESANCCTYATYWIYSGLLTIDKQKMSKSLGNQIPIKAFLDQWPAEVLRLGYLERHYSSNIDFSERVFMTTRRRLLYYYETLQQLDEISGDEPSAPIYPELVKLDLIGRFHKAMSDDFNTSLATAEMLQAFKLGNQILKRKADKSRARTAAELAVELRTLGNVLGLFSESPQTFISRLKAQVLPELGMTEAEILHAIDQRNQARAAKEWSESDRIRDSLLAKGIELRDGPQGTGWAIVPDKAEK